MQSIKHENYNCKATDETGAQHLVYANWIYNQGMATWHGYQCSAGETRFYIDKNFDIWSGECKNDKLGNVLEDWTPKKDTVCKRETCTGCTDDLITFKKDSNV